MQNVDVGARLAELEARIAVLESERGGGGHSMRQTHRCPTCGHGRVLHFRAISDVGHNHLFPFALQKEHSVWVGVKNLAAPVDAFVCQACRLVEWHVTSLDGVTIDGKNVVELVAEDAPPPAGAPYR